MYRSMGVVGEGGGEGSACRRRRLGGYVMAALGDVMNDAGDCALSEVMYKVNTLALEELCVCSTQSNE